MVVHDNARVSGGTVIIIAFIASHPCSTQRDLTGSIASPADIVDVVVTSVVSAAAIVISAVVIIITAMTIVRVITSMITRCGQGDNRSANVDAWTNNLIPVNVLS